MPRGCITVMHSGGYAAAGLKHCVRPVDMAGEPPTSTRPWTYAVPARDNTCEGRSACRQKRGPDHAAHPARVHGGSTRAADGADPGGHGSAVARCSARCAASSCGATACCRGRAQPGAGPPCTLHVRRFHQECTHAHALGLVPRPGTQRYAQKDVMLCVRTGRSAAASLLERQCWRVLNRCIQQVGARAP